jgi:hypothetical protein
MLIIGSRAAKHYINDFRQPKDHDVICFPDEFQLIRDLNPELEKHLIFKHAKKWILRMPKLQVEFEIAIPGSSGELLLQKVNSKQFNFNLDKCPNKDFPIKFTGSIWYANPEILFLIKQSHIGYQIHWDKNIEDYHTLKKSAINHEFFSMVLDDFMKQRAIEMRERFSNRKKIDLEKKNSEFFNATKKSVKRKYPHDLLHKNTCYYDRPLYERLKTDLSKAAVDETLWNALSHDDRIKAVKEEAFVIALERKIIPAHEKGEKWDRLVAFRWSLMRISTNLTNGFFQKFALENHHEIMKDIPEFDKMFFSKVGLAV